MKQLLKKTHRVLYFACTFFFFLLSYPFLLFFVQHPARYFVQIVWIRKWISVLGSYAVGIRYAVEFEQEIDWTRPYILCPNHTSIMDITALTYLCPQAFSFIGKIELLKNPVTRMFFKTIDIPVDRKSKISSFKAFQRGNALIQEGKSLVIFPEGKIDDSYPPSLHTFKSGAFRIALDNQVQILPIVIENAWELFWDDASTFGKNLR